jgi:type I restriction enzyme M protein
MPGMQEIMEWAYGKYGDEVYTNLKSHTEAIEVHIEHEDISLSPKNRKELLSEATWLAQRGLMQTAQQLATQIGNAEYLNFNVFEGMVDDAIKALGSKLSASDQKQILSAISWRDERAEKVIKKLHKLTGSKLNDLLAELDTTADKLTDYGYWPTSKSGEYIEYEQDSELRDTENVPLGHSTELSPSSVIHNYFVHEVRPHVDEAWLALGKTVLGNEISFNKYFYHHKPLRCLEVVAQEILNLEVETDGLLKSLIGFVGDK